jgi:hypothetical protein
LSRKRNCWARLLLVFCNYLYWVGISEWRYQYVVLHSTIYWYLLYMIWCICFVIWNEAGISLFIFNDNWLWNKYTRQNFNLRSCTSCKISRLTLLSWINRNMYHQFHKKILQTIMFSFFQLFLRYWFIHTILLTFYTSMVINFFVQTEEKEESVWASALSCLLYFVCDRGKIRRNRLQGLDIRVRNNIPLLFSIYQCLWKSYYLFRTAFCRISFLLHIL